MHVTSSVIIAKVIAAITLTASTAGGIALATTSTPAAPQARTTSETTATSDATPSLVITSPASTGALDDPENLAASDGTAGALAAEAPDTADAHGAVRTTPSPKAPHPTGRCRALANLSEDGQAGKATESPAFTDDLNCGEAGTAAGPTRPTGRPDVAPGKPDHRRQRQRRRQGRRGQGRKNREGRQERGRLRRSGRPSTSAGPRTAGSRASTARTAESPISGPGAVSCAPSMPAWRRGATCSLCSSRVHRRADPAAVRPSPARRAARVRRTAPPGPGGRRPGGTRRAWPRRPAVPPAAR